MFKKRASDVPRWIGLCSSSRCVAALKPNCCWFFLSIYKRAFLYKEKFDAISHLEREEEKIHRYFEIVHHHILNTTLMSYIQLLHCRMSHYSSIRHSHIVLPLAKFIFMLHNVILALSRFFWTFWTVGRALLILIHRAELVHICSTILNGNYARIASPKIVQKPESGFLNI